MGAAWGVCVSAEIVYTGLCTQEAGWNLFQEFRPGNQTQNSVLEFSIRIQYQNLVLEFGLGILAQINKLRTRVWMIP